MADGAVQEIRYVCVARRSDNVVIAQRVHTPARTGNFFQNVKRVLDSPGWATITSDKLTLDDGENTFYVLIDEAGRAYIAVASKAYPARHIYDSNDGRTEGFLGALAREFQQRFGDATLTCAADEYTAKAKTILKELCDKYNDLKNVDKLAKVRSQVNEIAGVMQDNIRSVLDRGDKVENLHDKAQDLNRQAGQFERSATSLKRNFCMRNAKMTLMIAIVVIIILAIIIAYIVKSVNG